MQVNWTKRTEVTPFQSLTFRQIDYLVVILSIVKSKPNTMKILNFGNQWTIIRSFSNLVLNQKKMIKLYDIFQEFLTPVLPKNFG